MNKRPKIKIKLNSADKVAEIAGWVLLLAVWILVITNYSDLPDRIPVHYNAAGQADAFGEKNNIWTLPLIGTILFIVMTIAGMFPHIFNYPSKITEENAVRQYTNATRMIRCLKSIFVVTFGVIALRTILLATGRLEGLGWAIPVTAGLIFIPSVYFFARMLRDK